jgi:hypothetical protein
MRVEWTEEFDRWLTRIEDKAAAGDAHANRQLDYVAAELSLLRDLRAAPVREKETAQLKWVRQHRTYEIWRVSHRYDSDVAIRLSVWFPPDEDTVVVTVFGGNKKRIGDAFYNSVGPRADAAIQSWLLQRSLDKKEGETDGDSEEDAQGLR